MEKDLLKERLNELDKRIKDARERYEFHEALHDGHKLTWPELVRRHEEVSKKIQSDLEDYKEKNGHLNILEEQIILFLDSLE